MNLLFRFSAFIDRLEAKDPIAAWFVLFWAVVAMGVSIFGVIVLASLLPKYVLLALPAAGIAFGTYRLIRALIQ